MKATDNTLLNYLMTSRTRPIEPHPLTSSDLSSPCKPHELVTDAEILWTLKVATSHYSYNSSSHTGKLFQRMFPESRIAKAFSCGEKKCSYVVCYGLRPFFLSCLQREIKQCDCYAILFDESLNEYLQRKQMDVRY